MKVTNKHFLPEAIVRAVQNDTHWQGDISATGLLKSPRQYWLARRHSDRLEVDAMDRWWALLGKAAHSVIESANGAEYSEIRLSMDVGGVSLTGTCDDFRDGIVTDWKTTSVWTIIYGSRIDEWEKQLNTYAALFRLRGFAVERVRVVAILRDWSASEAAKRPVGYPPTPVLEVPLRLWPEDAATAYINHRVAVIMGHKDTADCDLPECTHDERWAKKPSYAVMREGRKTAIRIHDCPIDADSHAAMLGAGHYVEERRGDEWKRCAQYCDCAAVCDKYQDALKNGRVGE